ncbi:MAG TPA: DUF4389 domain-containing protein [Micropepsaceae bacterium]|nr:DUF4389 domain-containing protein [Micropepsaceae bacterium]
MSDNTQSSGNPESGGSEGTASANAGGPAAPGAGADSAPPPPPPYPRPPFPWARLLYAIGFSFVAWAVFWVIVALLAPLHYITIAITGHANEELRSMSLRAVHYLFELLGFITGARDEKPFPLGPFPKD